MAWSLEGRFYENCSCTAICPCTWSNLTHKATNDYCRFALAFHVERGQIEGVDVSGRTFVLVGESPPHMLEGNWKIGAIVDDGATEPQVGAFGQVLSGALGGPPASLGPLLGEFAGLITAPMTIEQAGRGHRVLVGDMVDYSGEPSLTETGEQVQLTNIPTHPAGPTLGVAPVAEARVSAFGIEWSGQDLSGFSNRFAWSA